MTEPFPLLMDLIRQHSWTPHRKVLTCAPDVEKALWARSKEAMPPRYQPPEAVALANLMGIDIVISEDSPPGSWQLVRHDHCEVHYQHVFSNEESRMVEVGSVTHQDCTIICRQEGS